MVNLEILKETVVPFHEHKKLPGSPTDRQLRRYREQGLLNRITGKQVFLEWCRQGSTPVTSQEAYQRFLTALNTEEAKA